jgi:hypothetical protein
MNTLTLSKAVSELLSHSNKNKVLGEASKELNDYIIKIKDLVDTGDITLEELRNEITKHIKKEENIMPNSLAQLLVGCVGDKETCLMKQENPEDVPFIYDHKSAKLHPLSKNKGSPLTNDSIAVLYSTCSPEKINIDSLRFLENRGFKKLRIEYKDVKSSSYKIINLDNLKSNSFQPYIKDLLTEEKDIYKNILSLGFILLLIFFIYKMQK